MIKQVSSFLTLSVSALTLIILLVFLAQQPHTSGFVTKDDLQKETTKTAKTLKEIENLNGLDAINEKYASLSKENKSLKADIQALQIKVDTLSTSLSNASASATPSKESSASKENKKTTSTTSSSNSSTTTESTAKTTPSATTQQTNGQTSTHSSSSASSATSTSTTTSNSGNGYSVASTQSEVLKMETVSPTVDRLNVRKAPSTTSAIIKIVIKKAKLEVLDKTVIEKNGHKWVKVGLDNGQVGYVAREYVK